MKLRPIATHVQFICAFWNRPDILFSVKVK